MKKAQLLGFLSCFLLLHTAAPKAFSETKDLNPADVIHWQVLSAKLIDPQQAEIKLKLSTEQEFSIYQENLKFSGPAGIATGDIELPPADKAIDPITEKETLVFREGEFTVRFISLTTIPDHDFSVNVRYIGCTQRICLFPHTEKLTSIILEPFPMPEAGTAPMPPAHSSKNLEAETKEETRSIENAPSDKPLTTEENLSLEGQMSRELAAQKSLWWLLIILFLGGLLTNLTPCVYPMIPITVRILSKQGTSPWLSSFMYSLGIVLVYSGLGLFSALTGSLFGQFMAHPLVNWVLSFIMFFLGLSMAGTGSFSFLQRVGSQLGAKELGLKKCLLMGFGAGLVASPCTGPILASLLTYIATLNDLLLSSLLLITYSFGFALPYLLLGGSAAKATHFRLPASLQVGTKYIFSVLILGLGFYYLRIPFYSFFKAHDDQWGTVFIASTAIAISSSLITIFLKHKWAKWPALLCFGLSLFLGTQLLAKRSQEHGDLKWFASETEAFEKAAQNNSPILIDMWAEWCEACKKMDYTTFKNPQVISYLKQHNYVLLRFDLTESDSETEQVLQKYGVQGLPTLILLPPSADLSLKQTISGFVGGSDLIIHLESKD